MPAKTQKKSQKTEKQNKNIIIDKTLKLLPIRQNLIPLKYNYFKKCSKPVFDFRNCCSIISSRPEKNSFALEVRLARKLPNFF